MSLSNSQTVTTPEQSGASQSVSSSQQKIPGAAFAQARKEAMMKREMMAKNGISASNGTGLRSSPSKKYSVDEILSLFTLVSIGPGSQFQEGSSFAEIITPESQLPTLRIGEAELGVGKWNPTPVITPGSQPKHPPYGRVPPPPHGNVIGSHSSQTRVGEGGMYDGPSTSPGERGPGRNALFMNRSGMGRHPSSPSTGGKISEFTIPGRNMGRPNGVGQSTVPSTLVSHSTTPPSSVTSGDRAYSYGPQMPLGASTGFNATDSMASVSAMNRQQQPTLATSTEAAARDVHMQSQPSNPMQMGAWAGAVPSQNGPLVDGQINPIMTQQMANPQMRQYMQQQAQGYYQMGSPNGIPATQGPNPMGMPGMGSVPMGMGSMSQSGMGLGMSIPQGPSVMMGPNGMPGMGMGGIPPMTMGPMGMNMMMSSQPASGIPQADGTGGQVPMMPWDPIAAQAAYNNFIAYWSQMSGWMPSGPGQMPFGTMPQVPNGQQHFSQTAFTQPEAQKKEQTSSAELVPQVVSETSQQLPAVEKEGKSIQQQQQQQAQSTRLRSQEPVKKEETTPEKEETKKSDDSGTQPTPSQKQLSPKPVTPQLTQPTQASPKAAEDVSVEHKPTPLPSQVPVKTSATRQPRGKVRMVPISLDSMGDPEPIEPPIGAVPESELVEVSNPIIPRPIASQRPIIPRMTGKPTTQQPVPIMMTPPTRPSVVAKPIPLSSLQGSTSPWNHVTNPRPIAPTPAAPLPVSPKPDPKLAVQPAKNAEAEAVTKLIQEVQKNQSDPFGLLPGQTVASLVSLAPPTQTASDQGWKLSRQPQRRQMQPMPRGQGHTSSQQMRRTISRIPGTPSYIPPGALLE